MGEGGRFDIADLKARVTVSAVVEDCGIRLVGKGREKQAPCPFHNERTPSFTVNDDKGFYHCFGCGSHGDQLSFLTDYASLTFADALERLAELAGVVPNKGGRARPASRPAPSAPPPQQPQATNRDRGAGLWRAARALPGTPGEAYLQGRRGIDPARLPSGAWPATIRFHPDVWHSDHRRAFPALLFYVQAADRSFLTVHRIYLTPAGDKIAQDAKKIVSGFRGGAIRLGPASEKMALAEGPETGLSIAQGLARAEPDRSVWVGISLGNLRHVVLPDACTDLLLCRDNDEKDRSAANALIDAAVAAHAPLRQVRVALPPAGRDFNDLMVGAA